jgi:hypothetical protein
MTNRTKRTGFIFLIFLLTSLNACSIALPTPSHSSSELQREPTRQATQDTTIQENTVVPTIILTKWDLWASGKTQLRGANFWQSLVLPDVDADTKGFDRVGPPFSQEDFNQLAALGANYIVLSVPGIFTENPPYQVDPVLQQNLDNLLQMAAKADLFATIAFRTGPGRAEWSLCCKGEADWNGYFNDSVWKDEAAQQAWAAMWKTTAEHYRNHPEVVGYELMVEPNSDDILLNISDPKEFYPLHSNTLFDWNQFYPKIIGAIREVDQDTPIIVGSAGYSNVDWLPYLQPFPGKNIVYDVHQYQPDLLYTQQGPSSRNSYPGNYDLNGDGQMEQFDQKWLLGIFQQVLTFSKTNKVTIAANEYGIQRWVPNAAKFIYDQTEIFETNGWNYAIWEWSTSYLPFSQSVNEYNFRLGPDPSNTVNLVANELLDTIKYFWQRNLIRPSNAAWNKLS